MWSRINLIKFNENKVKQKQEIMAQWKNTLGQIKTQKQVYQGYNIYMKIVI